MALSALKGWYPFIRLITLILSAFAFALTAALFPIIDDSPWYTGVYGELHPASVAPPMAGFSWSMFYSAFILVFMCTGGTSHPCVDVGIDLISWLLNMGSGVWTVLLIQGLEGSIASWVCDDFLEPANPHDCSNARKIDGFWNTSAVVSLLVGVVHMMYFLRGCVETRRLRKAKRAKSMELESMNHPRENVQGVTPASSQETLVE